MEIASEGETAIAKGDVRIQRGRFEATCEEVFYSESEERLILYIDPKVFQVTEERAEGGSIRRNELAGDTISVKLEENAVRRVKVVGNAEAVSALSDVGEGLRDRETRRSFLKGHTISMALDQERLTEMTVGGHAVSLHDAPLERGEESTRTFATGDTIRLLFDEGSIHQVLIKGGVQGIYYFHKGEREAGG
jgi:hypothetical protein